MDKTTIIKTLRDMAKYPTVTLPRDTDALKSAADLLEQAEKHSEFIKHTVANTYDWSEWVCPDPESYLMKCCDCGLVHEAEFKVVRYKSETEREDCEPVDDPNVQAVFRMRRSEQWSPEDTAYRPGGLAQECSNCGGTGDVSGEYPGIACPECSGKGVIKPVIKPAEQAQPVAQLMDMIVGNLVREGVNKHRARELADHFIKQSNYTNGYCTVRTDLLKEQAEKSEPVATMWQHGETGRTRISTPDSITDCDARWFKVSDLYTTPPPRQPLTDEEIAELWLDIQVNTPASGVHEEGLQPWRFARAIEAKLKEKNT